MAQARLLARSGFERASSRLANARSLFRAWPYGSPEDWPYLGEDRNANTTLDAGEDTAWGLGTGTLDRERLPLRFARRPSYPVMLAGLPRTTTLDGRSVGYSGRLRGAFGTDSCLFSLRVEDHSAKIYLNGGSPAVPYVPPNDGASGFNPDNWGGAQPYPYTAGFNTWPRSPYEVPDPVPAPPYGHPAGWSYNRVLADIVNKLARHLNRHDGTGAAKPKHNPSTLGPDLIDRMGDVILQNRPASGYATLDELATYCGFTRAQIDQLRPYVTTIGVPDPTVARPKHHWINTPNPRVVNSETVPRFPYFDAPLEPRSPINVNRAPRPVLVALLEGLTGAYTDYILTSMADQYDGIYGCIGSPGASVYATNAISQAMAERIADKIIDYRQNKGAFDNASEFSWFVDHYNPGGGVFHWNQIWDLNITRRKLPGTAPGMTATTAQEFDIANARLERELMLSLVKANAIPNNLLNKFNADLAAHHTVDKSDLVRYSTEFSFRTTGLYEVDALGWVAPPGRAAITAAGQSVLRVFDRLTHTTQADFHNAHAGGDDYGATAASEVVSLPEALVRGGPPAGYDGQVAPQHTGSFQGAAGTIVLRQDFDESLTPDSGAPQAGNDWMPGGIAGITLDEPAPWNNLQDAPVLQSGDLFVHGGYLSGHRGRRRTFDLTDRNNAGSPFNSYAQQGGVEFWLKIDHEFAWQDSPTFTGPQTPGGDFPVWWPGVWGAIGTDLPLNITEQAPSVLFSQHHTFPIATGSGSYDALLHSISIRSENIAIGQGGHLYVEAIHMGNADAWPAPFNRFFMGDNHGPRPAGLNDHTDNGLLVFPPATEICRGSHTEVDLPLDQWTNHQWHHMAMQWREGNLLDFWMDGTRHPTPSPSADVPTGDFPVSLPWQYIDPTVHRIGHEHDVINNPSFVNSWYPSIRPTSFLSYATFRTYRVCTATGLAQSNPFGAADFTLDAYPAWTTSFRAEMDFDDFRAVAPEATAPVRILAIGWDELRPERQTRDDGKNPGEQMLLFDRTAMRYEDAWPAAYAGPLGPNEVFHEAPDISLRYETAGGPSPWFPGDGQAQQVFGDVTVSPGATLVYAAEFDPKGLTPVLVAPVLESVSVYFARPGFLAYRILAEDE